MVKSRVSAFSRGKLEEGRNELGFCSARDESMGCCCFLGVLYADDVRFHSCHPYIHRASTDALIRTYVGVRKHICQHAAARYIASFLPRPFPVKEKRLSSPETAWVYYYTRLAARQRTAAQRLLYRAIMVIGYTNADISSMDYCSVTAVITVLALVTGGWGSPNGCSAPSPVSLSSIVASTYNDTGLEIVIRRNEIICNSYAYDKLTVLCLYDRCNETSSMQNTESVVLDIICRDGVWELTRYERFAYTTISTENCTDCVAVELFESRQYPINPPDRLAYNQTTHCLSKCGCV